ncbi:MAG: 50S ribosomal protein L28 [Candidatus Sumerlaeia bacterium]|jgi:large subunit ribosomal protein L28|nr:50S ribosomal protein L28 [Candidatus Sumerlaeia bacterium]
MAKCEITGKRKRTGNNVSHANNKTKRTFKANIQKVRIEDESGVRRRAWVSTSALRDGAVQKRAPRKVLLQLAKEVEELGG